MKTFLKMLLASIVGGLLLLFIFFVIIASLASFGNEKPQLQEASILKINLNKVVLDRAQDNPFSSIDPLNMQPDEALGLNTLLATLRKAAKDEKIEGIYLEGGIPLTGSATLSEYRKALKTFADSGKFIYGYTDIMTQNGVYLTSVVDSFFVNPEGVVEWKGLNAAVTYYKKAAEKLGVEPVVLRATGNKFKSAVEPFLRDEMSPENRMQLSALLASVWGTYLKEIALSKKISIKKLNSLADSLLTDPKVAAQYGLIAGTLYEDEVLQKIRRKMEVEDVKDINFVSFKNYADGVKYSGNGGYDDAKIAVVYAQGGIEMGEGDNTTVGAESTAKAIRKARKDEDVKAIVLRINSPGGSALASEIIWREVALARKEKPIIASMGNVAASGGYYIACYADTIVAQPNTITGSIGAFGLFFTAEELMNEKLGINIETVKTNHFGDLGTIDRDITAAEKQRLIKQVDRIYDTFLQRVATGRGMTVAMVDSLGQGRVYSGENALNLNLVDVLGGLNNAVEIAGNKAGLEKYRVVEYPKLKDPIQKLLEDLGANVKADIVTEVLGENQKHYQSLRDALHTQGLKTHLGYHIEIK